MEYDIVPMPKPRMTRRDKWKGRPCVVKYWAFKREIRRQGVELGESGVHTTFILPMPKSWSKKKKDEMDGKPHTQIPDIDNLAKALLDAIFDDDSHIWDARFTKLWGKVGKIIIRRI